MTPWVSRVHYRHHRSHLLCVRRAGLHRVTATYLEHNPASGRVLAANGFRHEGYLRRNLHIDGAWQDHHYVALVKEDFASTAVERLRQAGRLA